MAPDRVAHLEPAVEVGGVTVVPIVESVLWNSPYLYAKGQDHDAAIAAAREWSTVSVDDDGWVCTPVRCYLVQSQGRTMIVDSGQGCRSPFADGRVPRYRAETGDLLAALADAGVAPEDVDVVIMTHAHPDHIGWNVRPEGDALVPAFPNARYLICDAEWPFVEELGELAEPVRIVDAHGLLDRVPADHAVTDEVHLVPTHGHTPGHVCVAIASAGEQALIIGDVIHHKISLAHPELPEAIDNDEALATRRALLERLAGSDTRVFATHFEVPAVGYFRRRGGGYVFTETP